MFIKARKRPIVLAIASCLALLASSSQAQVTDLGTLGGSESAAYSVSADGAVVVGGAKDGVGNMRAFRWVSGGGMTDLGALGGIWSSAYAISADGFVIVGAADTGAGAATHDITSHAFRWTQSGGMVDLGTLGGGASYAYGVSADGLVVVGSSATNVPIDGSGGIWHAFRWTSEGGMVDLGTLGGASSQAKAVSADGVVVVGDSQTLNGGHAFRWTQANGMYDLGTLGGSDSWASGASADGSVVVGGSWRSDGYIRAFRWTSGTGMVDLGVGTMVAWLSSLNQPTEWISLANGVSADGAVVVGQTGLNGPSLYRAFRWTQASGMQSVEDWLRTNGVIVANDITYAANATNSDGSVVVGSLENGRAFIARVSSIGSGLVTLADVQNSLSGTAAGGSMALTTAGLAINGAHSRPLMRRVSAGQKTFWVAGDWGRDDHGSRAGSLGLAELGGGYNFGRVQLNVSLGQTWASQKLVQNGRAEVDGTYLQAEAIMPVVGNTWATLGAYHHQGSTELKRGYLNAGTQDYSTGRPDVSTTGLRARLDWDNALQVAGAQFSPYADLSYAESSLDGYTETGGGFPARFNARKERSTEFRLGLSATKAVAENVSLVGQLEGVHRFERHGAGTSGQVVGLFGFNLPGSDVKQDWLRAGFGVQGKLAGGAAHVMLNATTQGAVPNIWLAAGWQIAF